MRHFKMFTIYGTGVLAVALAAGGAGLAYAQRNDRNRSNDRGNDHNQYQRQDRNERYHHFDDHDRQNFRNWYSRNRHNAPWVRDRLPSNFYTRIRPGYRIGPDMWRYYRPVPYSLARTLPLPPPGYRYVMIGNQIVLVDAYDTVREGFTFQFNF